MLSEVVSEEHTARAFSVVGMSSGLGRTFGPVVGGFLAQPATKYPEVFGNIDFFVRFPYSIPCLIAAFLVLLSCMMGFLWIPETLRLRSSLSSSSTTPTPDNPAFQPTTTSAVNHDENTDDEQEFKQAAESKSTAKRSRFRLDGRKAAKYELLHNEEDAVDGNHDHGEYEMIEMKQPQG